MSESPKSEKCQTRYSTPVPELDDHRFQSESLPRTDAIESAENRIAGNYSVATRSQQIETVGNAGFLQTNDPSLNAKFKATDFEYAVEDDDDVALPLAECKSPGIRKHSVSHGRDPSNVQRQCHSRASSVSSRSSSPPNSVDAFAEPRRRERANTMESCSPVEDAAISLHRTVSVRSHRRRPTFSNVSAIRPDSIDPRVNPTKEADICFPPEVPGRIPIIDFEELEEFVALRKQANPSNNAGQRKHSLSSQSKYTRVFYDLRGGAQKAAGETIIDPVDMEESYTGYGDSDDTLKAMKTATGDEKSEVEVLTNNNESSRFSFFSSELETTVHATELGDLVLPGNSFRDLFQLGPDGGVWWLDVISPAKEEIGAICRAFSIHPLTAEDIMTQEAREKVELFRQYYFVCFRTFNQIDKSSDDYLEPVNFYMVVFREGVISFSFADNPHSANVRKRIGRLRDFVSLSSDWICYAMIDDIVDSFGPVIHDIEVEAGVIEDDVYIARVEDFHSLLRRICDLRKTTMSLMRLLGGKADVIKGFAKRCNEQYSVTPRGDIGLYLGDIQDHVVTMMSSLGHFEKMLSRSHSNYLTQINVQNIMVGNSINGVLSKITFLGSILVPMHLISGLFGMNVHVPGEGVENLHWFFGILGTMATICLIIIVMARRYRLL